MAWQSTTVDCIAVRLDIGRHAGRVFRSCVSADGAFVLAAIVAFPKHFAGVGISPSRAFRAPRAGKHRSRVDENHTGCE